MGFFGKIFGRSTSLREVSEGGSGSDGDNTVLVHTPDAALKVSAFYAGVELRARTMAQLVWQYQRLDRVHGNYIEDNYGNNGRLNYLLQVRPNPLMSAFDLKKGLELEVILRGNGYIYIERGSDGFPHAFWLCTNASYNTASANYSSVTYMSEVGALSRANVPVTDVLHIRNTYTYDGINGISVIRYMSDILSLEATNVNLQRTTAANGGKMKLLLQEDKSTKQGLLARSNQIELKKIADKLNDEIYSKDVVMLNNVAGITPISMTMADLQILEDRRLSVEDIARFLSVPQTMLGVTINSTYKTPQNDMQHFMMRCTKPSTLAIAEELNAKLLTYEDFGRRRIHVCDKHLMHLDPTGTADLNRKLCEMGGKTVNDVRKDYDMPSVDGGDIVYVSAQWAELGSEKLSNNGSVGDVEPQNETHTEEEAVE